MSLLAKKTIYTDNSSSSSSTKEQSSIVLFSSLSNVSNGSKVHRFRQTSVSLVKSFVDILARNQIVLSNFSFSSRVGRCFFLRRREKNAISQSLNLRIFVRRTVNFVKFFGSIFVISLRSRRLRRLSLNVVWRKRQSSTRTRRFR